MWKIKYYLLNYITSSMKIQKVSHSKIKCLGTPIVLKRRVRLCYGIGVNELAYRDQCPFPWDPGAKFTDTVLRFILRHVLILCWDKS